MEKHKCARCGRVHLKADRLGLSLPDGSKGEPDICAGCNAARWVVRRLLEGGSISMEECRKLPRNIIFDSKGDDSGEEAAGREFQKLIDSYITKAEHK